MENDNKILEIDAVICKNIAKFDISDRGLLSQNILSQLRNFVEHIALKVYANGQDIDNRFNLDIKPAIEHLKSQGKYKFISKFHSFLQISASHYTVDPDGSERLMLKYYEYLIRIKKFVKDNYQLEILANISDFPINTDRNLKEFYEKIAERINGRRFIGKSDEFNERYYIQKIKPFFVANEIYYEVTFTEATSRASKFDRIIAFTKIDITKNYSAKLTISESRITILGKTMPILLIDSWEVSVRPCEFNNFAKILGVNIEAKRSYAEYKELMQFLTNTGFNLVELIELSDKAYNWHKERILERAKSSTIFGVLDRCRAIVRNNYSGSNVLRYLLYRLNNKVMKYQTPKSSLDKCGLLSYLRLKYGCIPFDEMPFNSSLLSHNPKLSDLFDCINADGREHELFARLIKNNTEIQGKLYTSTKEIVRLTSTFLVSYVFYLFMRSPCPLRQKFPPFH
ncbi:MAG: hypothetical protein LBL66_00445 [Clostridiales bacterium]|jgi:hypothetical protein|nr:hypothetical protein [Clostridiales bacterium]